MFLNQFAPVNLVPVEHVIVDFLKLVNCECSLLIPNVVFVCDLPLIFAHIFYGLTGNYIGIGLLSLFI